MLDLVVVGGGFWGVATTLRARARGWDVAMMDSGRTDGGSRAASGYFSPFWFKGKERDAVGHAYRWAREAGVEFQLTGARVNGVRARAQHGVWHEEFRPDWQTFSVRQFLSLCTGSDSTGERVTPEGVVVRGGGLVRAKRVVVAAGAWTDCLLSASGYELLGVHSLAGSAVLIKATKAQQEQFAIPLLHELNPFKQVAMRSWEGTDIRVCATTETRGNESEIYVRKMLQKVQHRVEGLAAERTLVHGKRPLVDGGFALRKVADNIVAITGGGRIGAIYSFWMGEMACKALEAA